MSKLRTASFIAAMGFLGATFAYAQQTQPPEPTQPSTSQGEGTAADRTPPGATPTQGAQTQGIPEQADHPRPSTSETEGTAADTTPPGKTPTAPGAGTQRGELIGAAVVSDTEVPLGKVVDVVFDAKNQPEFVVISSAGKSVAVPYSVASSMKSADKIVMEPRKLQAAPKVQKGEWRSESGGWKDEATRYWNQS